MSYARRMIYLDNQATTACDPRVLDVMLPWFTTSFGNPHSAEHAMGQQAADAVEQARRHLADLLRADPRELVFTSGATESNNLAIKGAARQAMRSGDPRRRVVTLATEHPCVLETVRDLAGEGFEPVVLPVEPDGRVDPDRLREALRVPTLLVSIMAVNNETGVIQDLSLLAPIVHAAGALLHSDLAQAVGKLPVDVRALDLDLASISGHKFYGPKGVGALFVRRRPRVRLVPLMSGGGQERGLRSGTLPAPLVVGLGEAARVAGVDLDSETARIAALRDQLLIRLQAVIPGILVNGSREHRIAGNLNLRFPGGDALAIMAAMPNLCVSTGSACSAADIESSHVLAAMGLSRDQAARSLRLGIGRFTSADELGQAADMLADAHALVHSGIPVPA
ncbi:cysteine desulfurase [Lichenicola cladoniae]|uniref:Cysteine desulfurase n=1 Tax=Lichenicola cladoniae TaxID=1484109 RepID=A0A6M8HSQ6_9PROT|nr:cysteine desulfurase family protein [Lichenicola cladoniae]NPD65570.1 cysteine desulfurase [Acetobacteraceae bacterium]QKE91388.1 cysteine desulfurase [Lichenicola cladoniae]